MYAYIRFLYAYTYICIYIYIYMHIHVFVACCLTFNLSLWGEFQAHRSAPDHCTSCGWLPIPWVQIKVVPPIVAAPMDQHQHYYQCLRNLIGDTFAKDLTFTYLCICKYISCISVFVVYVYIYAYISHERMTCNCTHVCGIYAFIFKIVSVAYVYTFIYLVAWGSCVSTLFQPKEL